MENSIVSSLEAYKGIAGLGPQTFRYLDELQKTLAPDVVNMSTGMVYGPQNKYVTVRFDEKEVEKLGSLELLQITDVQFGHVECRVKRVIEYRDWVLDKPNRFMLWTGDNIDAWALWSPGMAWDNLFSPQSQVYRFCELWAPARHRILGYVGGNHERRAIPAFGDLGVLIATLLRIPYSDGRQFVDVHFGEHTPFKIDLWHGRGGARTKGTVAQVLDRFMSQGDAYWYLMGHLHQALDLYSWRLSRKGTSGKVKLEKITGSVSTSFMSYFATYAEVHGLSVSDVMMARMILYPNGHCELTRR